MIAVRVCPALIAAALLAACSAQEGQNQGSTAAAAGSTSGRLTEIFWGTLNTALLLLSAIPNQKAKAAAQHLDLQGLRIWLGVSLVFGAAFLTIRVFEFGALNVWWDSNAYGSVVWTLLGFHTVHLLTDVLDSIVLMVLLFTGPLQESHFTDAAENALYWDFVVISWLPVYACIYLAPRLA